MTCKRWCLITAALLALTALLTVLTVVIVDPFEIYHSALFYSPPYNSATQVYSNAGVARNLPMTASSSAPRSRKTAPPASMMRPWAAALSSCA